MARTTLPVALHALLLVSCAASSRPPEQHPLASIFAAALPETAVATPNISTEEMEAAIAGGQAVILDARPRLEWAISHIPTALNVAPKPGVSISLYVSDVAEIDRLVNGDKAKPLILYCNGLFCGKSKRLAEELMESGYTDVRRYQLGAPVWRALGKVMVIEPAGVRYVLTGDRTAVFIDTRDDAEPGPAALTDVRRIPRSRVLPGKDVGEIKAAKDDGRLPMNDHNTRIVVFGQRAEEARHVAEAITREAFHNVSFFNGSLEEFRRATGE